MDAMSSFSDESWSFKDLAQSQRLRGYEVRSPEVHPILKHSFEEPEAYIQALHQHFQDAGYHSQTVINERYALYWDLVEAKLGHRTPVLSVYQEDLDWQHFSYDIFHRRVSDLAIRWTDAGIVPGTTITLMTPLGYEFLLGLMTGLKLGATMSWVSPIGPTYRRNRIERLESEFIAAHPKYHQELDASLLDFERSATTQNRSAPATHHYEPDAVVLKLLSPLAPVRDTPVELSASDLYHRLLNDVLVVLELNAADRVSAPGLDAHQIQPWLGLATMLAGGTYLHIRAETLHTTPQAWTGYRPTILGLDDQSRKLMVTHQSDLASSLRLWFRDIAEPLDWQGWQNFQEGFGDASPWGMNLLVNGAFGGTVFFSPKSNRVPPINVIPAPGIPWSLLDQTGPGETRRRSTGLYAAPDTNLTPDHHGTILLSHPKPHELYFIASRDGVSGARTYPVEEVQSLVETLPSVSKCLVLQLDRLIDVDDVPVNLLIFLNRSLRPHFTAKEQQEIKSRIRDLIRFELGASFLPSELTLSHCYPELSDGALDVSWTQSQHYRGFLEIKEELSIFSTLSALRTLVDESKDQ